MWGVQGDPVLLMVLFGAGEGSGLGVLVGETTGKGKGDLGQWGHALEALWRVGGPRMGEAPPGGFPRAQGPGGISLALQPGRKWLWGSGPPPLRCPCPVALTVAFLDLGCLLWEVRKDLAAGCSSSGFCSHIAGRTQSHGVGYHRVCATEPGTTEPDATQLGTMKLCDGHRGATHVPTEPSDPAAGVVMVPAPWWGETPLPAPPDMLVCPCRCPGQARRVPGAGHGLHRRCHPGEGPLPHQQPSPPNSKSWGGSSRGGAGIPCGQTGALHRVFWALA